MKTSRPRIHSITMKSNGVKLMIIYNDLKPIAVYEIKDYKAPAKTKSK